ncbi:MAG: cytochrome P450, partial [Candidatus Binataceae bacterium]
HQCSENFIKTDNTPPGIPLPQNVRDAFTELREYFIAEIEKRRRNPGDDLISVLVAAHEGSDDVLSEAELVAFVVILLLAGNETTTDLIGNGMLALTRHPGELERLGRSPELMPSAIEEMLRYDGPVQATMRHIRQDTEIGGTTVAAGSLIFVLLAAANRDPAQFREPETFDIARTPNDHLAFGEGIHFCIGAPLARMEGAIAIGSLLARYKRIRPAAPEMPITYKGSFFLRGLASLPLEVS